MLSLLLGLVLPLGLSSQTNPALKSINAIAFNEDGVLFIGDSQNGAIFALELKDEAAEAPESVNFKKVDEHVAAMLGTTASDISIQDMAVNPVSKAVYLGIHLQNGTPVLLKFQNDTFSAVELEAVKYSKLELDKTLALDAKDKRGRDLRKWTISALDFHKGHVLVSGLSSEEFSSTFRQYPYPFTSNEEFATLEVYHAAHGRYETYAPIKTFMPYPLNGEDHLVASYTCTPLVVFPMSKLKKGEHITGNTVAELGNRNTPLDIISYKKGDKPYLLLANTTRAVMKIDPAKVEQFSDYLKERVSESSGTAGVDFIALPYVNVLQMDKFSDEKVLFLQRMSNGDLNLHTPSIRRL